MINADPDLARKRICWKIGSIEEQIENLRKSSSDTALRIKELQNEATYLRSIIE